MAETARLFIGLTSLAGIGVGALTFAGVAQRKALLIASLRAVVQLAIVAAALRGVFEAPLSVVAAITVMFSVATVTSARRLRGHERIFGSVVLASGAGALIVIGIILGIPVLTRSVRTLVAVSGIVFGGTMTAATLTGRRLSDGLHHRRDEVEAWLSIGATPRQAVRDIARAATFEALVPALDQTRTVGLVTLPGAFVGALLGGASATDAARFQVVVLVGLLCAQAVTSTILAWLLGAPKTLPIRAASTAR